MINHFVDSFCKQTESDEGEGEGGPGKMSGGMGLGDGEGQKDVSDRIENQVCLNSTFLRKQ